VLCGLALSRTKFDLCRAALRELLPLPCRPGAAVCCPLDSHLSVPNKSTTLSCNDRILLGLEHNARFEKSKGFLRGQALNLYAVFRGTCLQLGVRTVKELLASIQDLYHLVYFQLSA